MLGSGDYYQTSNVHCSKSTKSTASTVFWSTNATFDTFGQKQQHDSESVHGKKSSNKKRSKWTPTNSNQYLQPQLQLPLAAKSLTHQISRAVMHLDLGKDSSSGFGFGGRTWPHGPIPSNTIHTTVDVYCSTTLVVMSHILRVILGHCYCSLQGVFMVMTRTMVCSLCVLPPLERRKVLS